MQAAPSRSASPRARRPRPSTIAMLTFRPGSRHVVEIDAPRAAVWHVLTDAERHDQWLGAGTVVIDTDWPPVRDDEAVHWRAAPRAILQATRPDGVVTRLEIELHALHDRTLVVLHEDALHPPLRTRRRPPPQRARQWSRRALAMLRQVVEDEGQRLARSA